MGELQKALEFCTEGLKIQEEIGDKKGKAQALVHIGIIYSKQGKFKDAFIYSNRAMKIAKELGFTETIKISANTLKQIYQKQKKYKEAFEMYELEIQMRDSVASQEIQRTEIKKQMQYTYEKKELKSKAEQERKDVIANEEKQKQKIITGSISIGFITVLILGLFIYRGFRQKQKANRLITQQKSEVEHQKKLVEEKHQEITDSINYAERIQRALLASKKLLDENLKDYFILYKPKDVVSGDFYWASKTINSQGLENFILVTADSTGHGVPGAIMSIVNIACLDKAITKGITSADLILNETRNLVIENLKNDGSAEGGKDGSLLSFDFKNNVLNCASANNPIWIIRNSELIEIKPDRVPIGKHDNDILPFTLHTISLQKGDVVYTLTDGFPDQFGGENGKKFMNKNLKELLQNNYHLPMKDQKTLLENTFNNWIGKLDQVDDVTIIGVRI